MLISVLIILYLIFLIQIIGLGIKAHFFKDNALEKNNSALFFENMLFGCLVATIAAGNFSLFMPLNFWPFLLINIAGLYFLITNYKELIGFFSSLIKGNNKYHLLLFLAVFMLPVCYQTLIGITNSDTGHNHLPCIRWMEAYKAVPGLGNLFIVYGNCSSWFWIEALFSFSFTKTFSFYLLNHALILTFLFYITHYIYSSWGNFSKAFFIFFILLINLVYSYIYWHKLASATYEIAFTSIVVYLFLQIITNSDHTDISLKKFIVLSIYAFTIKQVAFPLILTGIVLVFLNRSKLDYKWYEQSFIWCFLLLFPFFYRNIISVGYPLYPYTVGSFIDFDWKVPAQILKAEQKYIEDFAKLICSGNFDKIELYKNSDIPLNVWVKDWYTNSHLYLKITFISSVFSLFSILLFYKKITAGMWIVVATSIFSLAIWFFKAPIPRYGLPYLIILQSIGFSVLITRIPLLSKLAAYGLVVISLGLITKCILNFQSQELTHSLPYNYNFIQKNINGNDIKYNEIQSKNCLTLKIPLDQFACFNELICTPRLALPIEMRTNQIQDGFRVCKK